MTSLRYYRLRVIYYVCTAHVFANLHQKVLRYIIDIAYRTGTRIDNGLTAIVHLYYVKQLLHRMATG